MQKDDICKLSAGNNICVAGDFNISFSGYVYPGIQVQNEELLFPYLLVKWALLLLPVVLIAWSFACLLRQPVEASASDSTRGDDSG